jgi:hypothetical protein
MALYEVEDSTTLNIFVSWAVLVQFHIWKVIVFYAARKAEKRNGYRLLVGKLEGKRPLGRPRRRWVDDIFRDLEIG